MAVASRREAEVQKARDSKAYRAAKEQLQSRPWRMANLYWIKDKDGIEIPFRRNAAQQNYASNAWFRDVILKARQLGFSTEIAMQMADDLIFRKNTVAAIIDYKLPDAEKKLDKIRFAYTKLPQSIRQMVRPIKDNDAEMTFTNGSSITVGTSFRGDTPQTLHVSEYGKTSVDNPLAAKEIKVGAFQAVGMNGKVVVEATAHGTSGEFFELEKNARKSRDEGRKLTRLDFKQHFYPWWKDPNYQLPSHLVVIPQETIEYFQELRAKYGIVCNANQIAWYQTQLGIVGPDDIKSEYPSHEDEAFFNSMEGAYFKRQMSQARADKRIGQPVPYDPTRPVNTFLDIGNDDHQAIWFHQSDGVRHRLIDFSQNDDGGGIHGFIRTLKEKQTSRHFIYGKHYGPHDLEVTDWSNAAAQTRAQVAASFGIKFIVVPRIDEKGEAIDIARRFLATCFFDSVHCAKGVEALDSYRKTWNEKLGQWGSEPLGNWASHPADALMTGACGWAPDLIKKAGKSGGANTGTSWSS